MNMERYEPQKWINATEANTPEPPSAASAGSSPCDRINAMVAEAKAMKDDGYYLWLLCMTAAEHLDKSTLSAVIIGCASEITRR